MYHQLANLPSKEILPGFRAKFVHTKEVTFAFWEVDVGAILPEHSHVHEQSAMVLEGKFELTVDGVTQICEPGAVLVIPSNAIHAGRAITACKITDVFCPVREDYK